MDGAKTPKNEIKYKLEIEKKLKLIRAELKNLTDLKSALTDILDYIKKLTGCEAVAFRLYDNGDYPYFIYKGFPRSFIKKENSLCSKNEKGYRISLPNGSGYLLECMCGNIIRGRFDPSLSFFTKNGSFWSNNTTKLLATTTEEERQARTRNYCNACGYESVALIPLKVRDTSIGLIQMNDMRKDRFTEDLIEYLETIGENIGFAVQKFFLY